MYPCITIWMYWNQNVVSFWIILNWNSALYDQFDSQKYSSIIMTNAEWCWCWRSDYDNCIQHVRRGSWRSTVSRQQRWISQVWRFANVSGCIHSANNSNSHGKQEWRLFDCHQQVSFSGFKNSLNQCNVTWYVYSYRFHSRCWCEARQQIKKVPMRHSVTWGDNSFFTCYMVVLAQLSGRAQKFMAALTPIDQKPSHPWKQKFIQLLSFWTSSNRSSYWL
jgi:hypothetical protein